MEQDAETVKQTHAYIAGSKLSPSEQRLFQNANKAEYQYTTSFFVTSGAGAGHDPSKHVIKDIALVFDGLGITGTLVPMCFSQTSGEAGIKPGLLNASIPVLLKRVQYDIEFVNQSPSSQFVTIYIVKAARDTATTSTLPSAAWETSVNSESGTAGAASVTATWPFGRPTPNQAFKNHWTTIHTFDCTLNPGEARRHSVEVGVNKIRDYQAMTVNTAYVKGISHYVFMVARGTPGDTSNTSTAGTIMFTPTKIIGIIGIKQYIAVTNKQSKIVNQFNDLPTTGSTNLYVINDDSGAATDANLAANFG